MPFSYIITLKSTKLNEFNLIKKKVIFFFTKLKKSKIINKSNITILRSPQNNKKSREQYKILNYKQVLELDFFYVKNTRILEKVLKKLLVLNTFFTTQVLLQKKIKF